MRFDIFFSISQTPAAGVMPSEAVMFRNFFDQVRAADELGFGTAWIAESHLSSEVQKRHREPVIPHWQGEVGLNVDFLQLAHHIFRRTRRIEAEWKREIPEGRLAEPREIGQVIAFLCTPAAGYIRGQSLAVDGGRMRSL